MLPGRRCFANGTKGAGVDGISGEITDHIGPLRRYALRLVRDRVDDADDLLQDSLVRALARRDLFKEGTNLRSWLLTVMHNVHANQMRRLASRPLAIDLDKVGHRIGQPAPQDHRILLREAARGLASLPREQRRAMLLVAIAGLKYEEVARLVQVPPGTVMSRVARGRDALRRRLTGDEPPRLDSSRHDFSRFQDAGSVNAA